MKASKHRPGCPRGGSLDGLLPGLDLGIPCQEEGHTHTDSGKEHLHEVSFAAASRHRCVISGTGRPSMSASVASRASLPFRPLPLELAS